MNLNEAPKDTGNRGLDQQVEPPPVIGRQDNEPQRSMVDFSLSEFCRWYLKTRSLQIRNIIFFVLFVSLFSEGPGRQPSLFPLAAAGLAPVVVLLTIRLKESIVQKCFFIAAGGVGAILAITSVLHDVLYWHSIWHVCGITLPMILICQLLFFIAAMGSIACLVSGSRAKDTMLRQVIKWGVVGAIVGTIPSKLAHMDYLAQPHHGGWGLPDIAGILLFVTVTPLGALIGAIISWAILARKVKWLLWGTALPIGLALWILLIIGMYYQTARSTGPPTSREWPSPAPPAYRPPTSNEPARLGPVPPDPPHQPVGNKMPSNGMDKILERNGTLDLDKAHWTVPKSWIRKPPKSTMLQAEYGIPAATGDKDDGRLTISRAGGSVDDNTTRWKGQFSKQLDNESRETIDAGGVPITLIDLTGTLDDAPAPHPDYRMLGAIFKIPNEDGLHFIKCYGPKKTITARADEIKEFLRSLKVDK